MPTRWGRPEFRIKKNRRRGETGKSGMAPFFKTQGGRERSNLGNPLGFPLGRWKRATKILKQKKKGKRSSRRHREKRHDVRKGKRGR